MNKHPRAPYAWNIWHLQRAVKEGPFSILRDGIIPARPLGYGGLWMRLRLAWAVFIGRADALYWTDARPKERQP
ncbi:hypothetical protein UFOVP326_108 [uncultured Caudovirales phage]|uniref:Uncharacterized protein n=1 Tax=uncultured Caudovirales phage TaxID=2100421 RepID=A0A6J5LXF4_9CAUD|nr:hypothetical protein UFOVP326_108 [uncultured Caudovirales phage]